MKAFQENCKVCCAVFQMFRQKPLPVSPVSALWAVLFMFSASNSWADPFGIPAITLTKGDDGGENYSVTIQILALMTVLSVLPALLMMVTSFTRIIIVFSILRQAIGLNQAPSNQVLIGLAMFMTFFVMSPVIDEVKIKALDPYLAEEMTTLEAAKQAKIPFHKFMLNQTRTADLELFINMSKTEKQYENPEDVEFSVLVPAFMTSELKTAFQIGFLLFIPFLIIDMVVASILMAMGMMMLSPLIISLPFKIMLFVMVDGWAMVMGTLASSFGTVL